jgi:heme oxygenase
MTTLKELTAEKHKEAETQPFIKTIFAGNVNKNKYVDYLYQLLYVYKKLEEYGDRQNLFSGMESIKRYLAIEKDYTDLIENPPYPTVKKSTEEYIEYLKSISEDPHKLMAHVYVRHMGDLFGGQMLAKLLPGSNNMFKFDNIQNLVQVMRSKLDISMADEANKAFQFNINILKEYND